MSEEVSPDEVAKLRAKWGLDQLSKEDAKALAAVQEQKPPAKVLVRKERIWGYSGMHFRWFLIGVDEDGSRRLPFTTTSDGVAYSEVQRYQKLGVPLEVMKEVEFE